MHGTDSVSRNAEQRISKRTSDANQWAYWKSIAKSAMGKRWGKACNVTPYQCISLWQMSRTNLPCTPRVFIVRIVIFLLLLLFMCQYFIVACQCNFSVERIFVGIISYLSPTEPKRGRTCYFSLPLCYSGSQHRSS